MNQHGSTSPYRHTVGVIGGSGLYALEGLSNVEEVELTTPFGAPSDKVTAGELGSTRFLFLPRHGRGHRIPPHRVNYRANVLALKQLGAEQVISVSAVGSMKEEIRPRDVVIVDQFIDRTRSRPTTFFDDAGVVAHVEFAEPVDAALSECLARAASEAGATVHRGGTYVCIEGPQFSTRAESMLFRSWGVDVIGMTGLPEARLAREAELPYATLALATDYDCWHQDEESVSVEAVLQVMSDNVALAKKALVHVARGVPDPSESPAASALKTALLTPPERIDSAAREKLQPLIARYLPSHEPSAP